MNDVKRKAIEALIEKAANAEKSEDAMRFSQAACNCSNAMFAVTQAETLVPLVPSSKEL